MQSAEVRAHLNALALTPIEFARLLGVGLRTVRRWTQPERLGEDVGEPMEVGEGARSERIPGPAEQALRAWLKLHRLGQHWRPDGLPLQHVDTAAAIARVRARGHRGPGVTWDIDLASLVAVMKGHRVSFVWQAVDRFALQTYCGPSNVPTPADEAARAALTDEACACIARRLAGERQVPMLALVLGDPVLTDDHIELRDTSLSPIVVCRLPLSALRAFLERNVSGDAALSFAHRNEAALADLASEIHARRGGAASTMGTRMLEFTAGDLGLVRGELLLPSARDRQPRAA